MGDLADGERRIEAAIAPTNHNPFKRLQPFSSPFPHLHLNHNGIPGTELGEVSLLLLVFQGFNDLVPAHGPASYV
jgi:hypothetical protein